MSIQHELITDPKIHEPKGVTTATAFTVYVANGSGSGSWSTLTTSSIDLAGIKASVQTDLTSGTITVPTKEYVSGKIPIVNTGTSSIILPIIHSSTVTKASFVLTAALPTANGTVNVLNSAAAAMGTAVTVPFTGSAKGNQFAFTANANNVLTGPTWMEITTTGGGASAVDLAFTVETTYSGNA